MESQKYLEVVREFAIQAVALQNRTGSAAPLAHLVLFLRRAWLPGYSAAMCPRKETNKDHARASQSVVDLVPELDCGLTGQHTLAPLTSTSTARECGCL